MSSATASRREFVTSLALGAGAVVAIAPAAAANEHDLMPVESDLRHVHRRLMERRQQRLRGKDLLSPSGLHNLLVGLREEDGVITQEDQGFLGEFIDRASNFLQVDELSDWIASIYNEASDRISDVAKGMSDFVTEKFEMALALDLDVENVRRVTLESLGIMIGAATVSSVIGVPAAALILVVGVGALLLPDGLDD